jgi:polyphosphate kinase
MPEKTERQPPEKFIHRDLSWLAFNQRVLEEAEDQSNPLLERMKFLAIFVSNLDEFYMVRVAGLKHLLDSGFQDKDRFDYYPQDLMTEIKAKVEELTKDLYDAYRARMRELAKENVFIKRYQELSPEQQKYAKKYFESTLFPIITPIAVDQGRPFPILPSKTMALAASLTRYDKPYLAIVGVPRNVPRLVKLPSEGKETSFIMTDELVRNNLEKFFKGYKIGGTSLFRIIRDSEISVDEEFEPDLLKAIETEIKKRAKAKVVYLEAEKGCSPEIAEFLSQAFDIPREDIAHIDNREMDLTYLFELISQAARPDLCYKAFTPAKLQYENIFDKIKENDCLIHIPFQSFSPTVDLIATAAKDPGVLAIKMTLYRTNEDSGIIKALKEAAKNKKQVTVLVEIKARFDEEKNINWVRELEEAGCHVMYGIAGMKIHSKITLIVRKEEGKICRYVHLSTGNYNEKTAALYTDLGYFTAGDDFAKDISEVFNVITGYSLPSRWKRIVSSPYDLRQYFFEMIDQEIECQKQYKNGLIMAKMNSLEDTKMIEKLYEASQAGVKIRLVVRGICCLIPGVPGLSENIQVKSVVGRFLEHSRFYIFNNNSAYRVFVASADWMSRNLDRRIELLFELYREELKEQLHSLMLLYWKDTAKSRTLTSDKIYVRPEKLDKAELFNIQEHLIEYYSK